MAIRISKNVKIILYVLLGVLVLGGSGYLIWVINNKDTVAPTDSDAGVTCPDGCSFYNTSPKGTAAVCSGDSYKMEVLDGCYKIIPKPEWGGNDPKCFQLCTTTPPPPVINCTSSTYRTSSDPTKPTGQRCKEKAPHTYECGQYCYTPEAGPKCCTNTTTTYTLKYLTGSNGTLTGNTTQTVEKGKSGTPVTAVPNEGYRFSHWERDGETRGSTNPRTDTNVQENITITARYAPLSVVGGICEDDKWVITPTDTYVYGTNPDLRVENRDEQGIDLDSIVVKFDGIQRAKCTSAVGETCYTTNVVNGYTRIIMQFEGYLLDEGEHTIIFSWSDGDGNQGCYKSKTFTVVPAGQEPVCGNDLCEAGEDSVNCPEDCGSGVPQTGLLDTVLGRVSIGFAFIFLGGLVSQYSKLNYMYESMQEKSRFRRDISREKRMSRSRNKFEKRVK